MRKPACERNVTAVDNIREKGLGLFPLLHRSLTPVPQVVVSLPVAIVAVGNFTLEPRTLLTVNWLQIRGTRLHTHTHTPASLPC